MTQALPANWYARISVKLRVALEYNWAPSYYHRSIHQAPGYAIYIGMATTTRVNAANSSIYHDITYFSVCQNGI